MILVCEHLHYSDCVFYSIAAVESLANLGKRSSHLLIFLYCKSFEIQASSMRCVQAIQEPSCQCCWLVDCNTHAAISGKHLVKCSSEADGRLDNV